MTVLEIYEEINKNRQFSEPQEVYDYIWELDKNLYDHIFSRTNDIKINEPKPYKYDEDDDTQVLAEQKYKDIYKYYVVAKYDFMYQDTESYSNNMIMYNQLFNQLACEFREKYRQKERHTFKF